MKTKDEPEIAEGSFMVQDTEQKDILKRLGLTHFQFKVTSELPALHRKASKLANTAQKNHDALLDMAGFKVMLSHGKRDVKDALSRGVRVRVITEKPENPRAAEPPFGFEHPLLTVKYSSTTVPICMMLFDDKELLLRLTDKDVPSFWSNNPSVINLSRTYFDEVWSEL